MNLTPAGARENPLGGPRSAKNPPLGRLDQGETAEEAKESLSEAVLLILEDRLEDAGRGLPDDVFQETIPIQ